VNIASNQKTACGKFNGRARSTLRKSSGGSQVEHVHVALLADAAQAPDPLLDLHRVPGQVEVAEAVGKLEVPPLAARLGAEQKPRRTAEALNGGLLVHARQAAVEDGEVVPGFGEAAAEHLLGRAELREDHQLVGEFRQQLQQAVGLRATGLLRGHGQQLAIPARCSAARFGLSSRFWSIEAAAAAELPRAICSRISVIRLTPGAFVSARRAPRTTAAAAS
jgi:hypothetical protein